MKAAKASLLVGFLLTFGLSALALFALYSAQLAPTNALAFLMRRHPNALFTAMLAGGAAQLLGATLLWYAALQSLEMQKLLQDLRFFTQKVILPEHAKVAFARMKEREAQKRQLLAQLVIETETMGRVRAMSDEVQEQIDERNRYATVAERECFDLS